MKPPVLRTTIYDHSVAGTISIFLAALSILGLVSVVWYVNRLPTPPKAVPVEILDVTGGFEDGAPEETLRVDSPDEERPDAAPAEIEAEEPEIAETLETLVEQSDRAAEQVQEQFETGAQNIGRKGRSQGTGRRGLGEGGGPGGLTREQRWYVRFDDRVTLNNYGQQLESLGIQLGALLPDGRLAYLSGLTQDRPQIRYATSGGEEKRLYMTWQAGQRRAFDLQFFKNAGLDLTDQTVLFHFYAPATEAAMARLEFEYRKRDPKMIRRTYFAVKAAPNNAYQFNVTRQINLN